MAGAEDEGHPPAAVSLVAAEATPAVEASPRPVPRSRRELWIEVLVVACLAVLPQLALAVPAYPAAGPEEAPTLGATALGTFTFLCTVLVPVLYLMARSGEGARTFGLAAPRVIIDSLGGLVSFALGLLLGGVVGSFVSWLGFVDLPVKYTRLPAEGVLSALAWTAMVVFAACGEEFVWRGYFLTRCGQLLGSVTWSLVITSLAFGATHLYQGLPGAASAAAGGLVYGFIVCIVGRIWATCLAHSLYNMLALAGPP
jgi:membrane protease YdiL (CAAX protease family)